MMAVISVMFTNPSLLASPGMPFTPRLASSTIFANFPQKLSDLYLALQPDGTYNVTMSYPCSSMIGLKPAFPCSVVSGTLGGVLPWNLRLVSWVP